MKLHSILRLRQECRKLLAMNIRTTKIWKIGEGIQRLMFLHEERLKWLEDQECERQGKVPRRVLLDVEEMPDGT